MTLPKRPPYKFVGKGFGRTERPSWELPDDKAPMKLLRAAVVQHEYLSRWQANYRVKWNTEAEFCKGAGLSVDQFGRLHRGESWMRMTDIAAFVHMLGNQDLVHGLPEPDRLVAAMQRAERLVEEERQTAVRERLHVRDLNLIAALWFAEVQEQQEALEAIRPLARPALERSAIHLRRQWFPDDPPNVRFDVRIETKRPGSDPVYVLPTSESIFGEVQLDKAWLAAAERSQLLEVDGHFILAYRTIHDGRTLAVDALRLLPTAWSPAVPPPCAPEYAASPATIDWSGGTPHLQWEQDDPLEAAATWVARFPPEMASTADLSPSSP